MSAVPKRKLTALEYLALEREAEFKSEFYDGEMFPMLETYRNENGKLVAMAGASRFHNEVSVNILSAARVALRGRPCRPYGSDQRVLVERTGLYTYPDVTILCEEWRADPADKDTLVNPTVIIEVLSPSTESYCRGKKFLNYRQIPSLKEYVLVSQNSPHVERFVRTDTGDWIHSAFVGVEAVWRLEAVGLEIPLTEVYDGVELTDPQRPSHGPGTRIEYQGNDQFRIEFGE